jgi:NADPH:quinone reductase-like Zn-dependent oxidoreductase
MGTKDDFEGAYELVASGRARPIVDRVFPLAEARAAHERLEAGDQLGKIVLTIPCWPSRSTSSRRAGAALSRV